MGIYSFLEVLSYLFRSLFIYFTGFFNILKLIFIDPLHFCGMFCSRIGIFYQQHFGSKKYG